MDMNRSGMILGSFLGMFHLVWACMVAVGFAQPILDFVYKIHFLNNPFIVQTFSLNNAVLLIAFTAVCGYVFGCILAFLWNQLRK